MYLTSMAIENVGPIEKIEHNFSFNEGLPKPTIFVGSNGSGKSIVISHIISSILELQGSLYENAEIDSGKVYKTRSPIYIKHGETFFHWRLNFSNGFYVSELQLNQHKSAYETSYGHLPIVEGISDMTATQSSMHASNAIDMADHFREEFDGSTYLLFPANRYEEPAWLNQRNLKGKATYHRVSQMSNDATREIINHSPLKTNQDWLLDIIYDSNALEQRLIEVPALLGKNGQVLSRSGKATDILNAIGIFLQKLFRMQGQVMFSVGRRGSRNISATIGGGIATNNIFTLSTGQSQVLNIFLSILRDGDLSQPAANSLSELKGIVLIDEIETNLHTELQYSILPEIIASFPKIQFIITSHSPLVILGLKNRIGEDLFDLIELPEGLPIISERFSEFEAAYLHFKETRSFENDVDQAVKSGAQDHIFVEGDIDRTYILRAAELLNREPSIRRFEILDGNGAGGLDGIVKRYDSEIVKILPGKLVLLYDCDTKKETRDRENLHIRKIPEQPNTIKKGIENLFSDATILKAANENPAVLDRVLCHEKIIRGSKLNIPETWSINPDEKRNLCTWLISKGDKVDFCAFSTIFDMMDEIQ